MTIALSANTPRVSYTVNQGATQTAFTVNFEFFDDADLNFYVDGTLKTLTTHYTVSGGDGSTGTINTTSGNTVTGASGGSTIVITRDIALARTTDFPSSGAFEVATLNTELDRFTAIASDISDETTRSIQLADDDTAVSMVLPLKADRIGAVLGFNATTGAVEAGPTITAVQSLSAVTASINLLGTSTVVEDLGLLATSTVIEDMGLLATSGNITAMGLLGVSGVITDMGILGTTAIVEDMGILATSANVTAMGVLGTSDNVTAMGKLGNDTTVADMAILATDAIVADMAILANSTIVDDLAILATSDIVVDMALLATSANVTAMGVLGTSGNVTAMGLLGTSAVVTDLGLLGTSAVVEDLSILATSANVTAMGLLGTSAVVEDMGLLGVAAVIEDMALLGVAGVIEDMGILGTSANVTAMSNVSGAITNVNTVASNLSGVNAFAARYRVDSSDPSSDNDEGDLFYNTSDNTFKFFNGSSYVAVNVSGIGNIVEDTSPQLGGNLDGQDKNITTTGVGTFASLDISGNIDVDGITNLDVTDIDGAVDMASTLQVDGAITSSAGMTITTADNTDQLILKSTDADANVGPVLRLNRDSGSPADNDLIGSIIFQADDDGGNTTNLVEFITQIEDASNGSESADLHIKTRRLGSLVSRIGMYNSTTVINEDSADIDFRVESNGQANMLLVDGGNDTVSFQPNSASLTIKAGSADATNNIRLEAGGTTSTYLEYRGYLGHRFYVDTTEQMKIDATGAVTMPNQPAFSVHKNGADQSNMPIADTTVTWTHERFDANADFNLTNNNFVAPVTGKYFLNFMARLEAVDTGAAFYLANIVTSNQTYRYIIDPNFTADLNYFKVQVTVLADMDANDTANVSFIQNGGTQQTDIDGDATETFFMGHLVA